MEKRTASGIDARGLGRQYQAVKVFYALLKRRASELDFKELFRVLRHSKH